MNVYERRVKNKYLKLDELEKEKFLMLVFSDTAKMMFELAPWEFDRKKFVDEGLLKEPKRIDRELKSLGFRGDELRFLRCVVVNYNLAKGVVGFPADSESVGEEFVRFVFMDSSSRAIKKFRFEGMNQYDRFRAFASVNYSALVKLCGKQKKGRGRASNVVIDLGGDFCSVVRALTVAGYSPFVDLKRLDRFIDSVV